MKEIYEYESTLKGRADIEKEGLVTKEDIASLASGLLSNIFKKFMLEVLDSLPKKITRGILTGNLKLHISLLKGILTIYDSCFYTNNSLYEIPLSETEITKKYLKECRVNRNERNNKSRF